MLRMSLIDAIPLPHGRTLALDRPRVMGILNVTPDSFSDGGSFVAVPAAVDHAKRMLDEGADLIDVGGESTRPGSQPVPADEQIRRVVPVIAALPGVIVSVDTSSATVARAALDAGASILNDVTAGSDPDMLPLAASSGAPIVLMHMQGVPATMQLSPRYHDVAAQVRDFLLARAHAAEQAGVDRKAIILDVGIGFGKTKEHNLTLLAALPRLADLGYPLLLGASRKRFMGSICSAGANIAGPHSPRVEDRSGPKSSTAPLPQELVGATCATTALGVMAGVKLFRVHDVQANRQAADVAWAIKHANDPLTWQPTASILSRLS